MELCRVGDQLIPKPQVYPLPQAIWMFRYFEQLDMEGNRNKSFYCDVQPKLKLHSHLAFPIRVLPERSEERFTTFKISTGHL
ncbi:hypothetical protein EYF80_046020 [Liparis tanakae]|uniref:Uncharacterized protein n=1 Tax=Liparis tanakae TaxID=230148 RepID=A0A4Z2FSP1_9TELE|nr:hypothetical protein EYF80_046020 [Liparis tanakae]